MKTPQSDHKICVKQIGTVDVTEMWRAREKELELEAKLEDRSKKHRRKSRGGKQQHTNSPHMGSSSRHKQENTKTVISWSSSKQDPEDCCTHEDDGLRDAEVEEFLHSGQSVAEVCCRFKNGMKLVHIFHRHVLIKMVTRQVMMCLRVKEEWENHVIGPEILMNYYDNESITWFPLPKMARNQPPCNDSGAETRLCRTSSSRKCHSKKRRSKEAKKLEKR